MGNVAEVFSKCFGWVENISQFDESFIKSYKEESEEGYFLEVDLQYPEKLHKLHNDLPFLAERMEIEKVGKLVTNLNGKLNILFT